MSEKVKRSLFPMIMTGISFVLFLMVYSMVTYMSVNPHYLEGLIFAIPWVMFFVVAILAYKGTLSTIVSFAITGILIPIFIICMFVCFFWIGLNEATTTTTDISKYERVIKGLGYPNSEEVSFFPANIPVDAIDVLFSYNPPFLQGGENITLRFKTDQNHIDQYSSELLLKAKWMGTYKDADEHIQDEFVKSLSNDFQIYVLNSEPYQENDWNHGEISLAAINAKSGEVIFQSDDW